MYLKQISVFLENKAGQLAAVTKLLADNQINLRALSIADTQNYGILRLIASDPRKAASVLSCAGFVCNVTEVFAVTLDDKPGSVSAIFSSLSDVGVNVEYAYAFVSTKAGFAHLVLRVSNNELAIQTLENKNIHVLDEADLLI